MIGENSVDLLRHSRIEASQASLHMGHWNMQLGCRQRPGEGGVGISVDKHPIRPLGQENLFDPCQHAGRLPSMASRSYSKIVVRFGDAQFFKENLGQEIVVVLTGVKEDLLMAVPELLGKGSSLDELRTGSHD